MVKENYNLNKDLRYLELLSNSFPTIMKASTEIINLKAILNLPKGTEHFLADIHGEYEAFQHVLKNASETLNERSTSSSATPCARQKSVSSAHLSITGAETATR